jgi:hypothetical protein
VTDLNELPALIRAHVLACDCTLDPAGAAGHDDTRIDKAAFGAVTAFRYTIRGTHTARRKHGHIATDPSDKPRSNVLSVSCTVPPPALRPLATSGKDGTYRSFDNGPSAASAPRKGINQVNLA